MEENVAVSATDAYRVYARRKTLVITLLALGVAGLAVLAMGLGSAGLSPLQVIRAILGRADATVSRIVLHIRLPRVLAALLAGAALSLSGCVMQNLLVNPLASDYTLGISQGAAFGAAVAIVAFGAGSTQSTTVDAVWINNPYVVTLFAFLGAILTTLIVLGMARARGMTPEAMILAGIAMGALFSAGTIVTQYFASDVQVASIVFWTFGDLGRSSWKELAIIAGVTLPVSAFFVAQRWSLNAMAAGDETARTLGVNVTRLRLSGMFLAALLAAVCVAFLGIIAFVGLVAPHLMRRLIGGDYRFLVPGSAVAGAFLLLAADTVGRNVVAPVVLPVGAITSFMGAPLFIYLLVRGYRR
ncbi:iron ABC transporter permease [Candidatus Solincola tengchongensis]|uniref:FecCD family ABC transporter permease n=1 Tax=Candidatus Solincola tengchongensis TaxID=2900693 RepID=UPI00257CD97A|nr:iron ABC transporter permease [Candidatus Solincola tengchongensis]